MSSGLSLALAVTSGSAVPSKRTGSAIRPLLAIDFCESNNQLKSIGAAITSAVPSRRPVCPSTFIGGAHHFRSIARPFTGHYKAVKQPKITYPAFAAHNTFRSGFSKSALSHIQPRALSARDKTDYGNAFQICFEGHTELKLFKHFYKRIRLDISVAKYKYLLDNSSEIIRQKQKELKRVKKVIHWYETAVAGPENDSFLFVTGPKSPPTSHVGTFAIELEREYGAGEEEWDRLALEPIPIRSLYHNALMRGRIVRFVSRRPIRDKRRFFRNLVRTLFKQMDDQSGHDEFLTIWQLIAVRNFSLTKFGQYMNLKDIIRQLEQISQAPDTTEEKKVALEEACRLLRQQPTIESATRAIQLLAGLAGIATYIQHITS